MPSTDGQKLTGSTKHVASWELPHTRQELSETSTEQGHTDHSVRTGGTGTPCTDVV